MGSPKEYLGRGWAFPFSIDPARGGPALSEYETNIRQCVSLILSTRPGERQMLPEFGCRIHDLLFAPNTSTTASTIAHYVRSALARWEPRIKLTSVSSEPQPNGTIKVQVEYTIRTTRSPQVVVHVLSVAR
jgi:phage baseplate assembly protein W